MRLLVPLQTRPSAVSLCPPRQKAFKTACPGKEHRRRGRAVVNRITYPVELIEVKRRAEGTNAFLLMNRLEPESTGTRPRPVSGARTCDEAFYKSERNSKSVGEFLGYSHQLEALVRREQQISCSSPPQIPGASSGCGSKGSGALDRYRTQTWMNLECVSMPTPEGRRTRMSVGCVSPRGEAGGPYSTGPL